MILSKDKQGNWTPTAGGTGTFIGTKAAFDAVKATLPDNTVAYITDDGNGDLQPVDAVTNEDMHPVTSNAVYDALNTIEEISFTPNTSNVSFTAVPSYTNESRVFKQGKLVVGHITCQRINASGYIEILSGLPIPRKRNNNNRTVNLTYVTDGGGFYPGLAFVNENGTLKFRSGAGNADMTDNQTVIDFTYFTD